MLEVMGCGAGVAVGEGVRVAVGVAVGAGVAVAVAVGVWLGCSVAVACAVGETGAAAGLQAASIETKTATAKAVIWRQWKNMMASSKVEMYVGVVWAALSHAPVALGLFYTGGKSFQRFLALPCIFSAGKNWHFAGGNFWQLVRHSQATLTR